MIALGPAFLLLRCFLFRNLTNKLGEYSGYCSYSFSFLLRAWQAVCDILVVYIRGFLYSDVLLVFPSVIIAAEFHSGPVQYPHIRRRRNRTYYERALLLSSIHYPSDHY